MNEPKMDGVKLWLPIPGDVIQDELRIALQAPGTSMADLPERLAARLEAWATFAVRFARTEGRSCFAITNNPEFFMSAMSNALRAMGGIRNLPVNQVVDWSESVGDHARVAGVVRRVSIGRVVMDWKVKGVPVAPIAAWVAPFGIPAELEQFAPVP